MWNRKALDIAQLGKEGILSPVKAEDNIDVDGIGKGISAIKEKH